MEQKLKFADIQTGDKLLVERHGFDRTFYEGEVVKTTNTRFTVKFNGYEQTFTRDGYVYPRETGYSRTYTHLHPLDDKGQLLIKKHKMASLARNLAAELSSIFGNANFRNKLSNMDMDHTELEESIKVLQDTYARFKKYKE